MVDAAREKELKDARLWMMQFLQDNPKLDLHADIGVARTATPDEIEKAVKKKAKDLHPDAAERTYIASKPELKAQLEAMEQAARDKAKGLSADELAEFRSTNIKRFERMPDEQVRGIIADKEIGAGKHKLMAPHKGAIEYHAQQNMAKLQQLNMHKDIMLNPDKMNHYTVPENRVGAAHRPHAPAQEPPRATTPPPASPPPQQPRSTAHSGGEARGTGAKVDAHEMPPRASARPSAGPQANAPRPDNNTGTRAGAAAGAAAQATAGGGSGGGVPPETGQSHAHAAAEPDKPRYKTTSRAGVVAKAVVAVAAAVGIGWAVTDHFNDKAEKERATAGHLKPRVYDDVRAIEAKDGPVRLFVNQALGIAGLAGHAAKQNGRELQNKTGLTPQQFFQLNQALRAQEVQDGYYGKLLKGQEASTTFILNGQGKFEAIKPGKESDYADSLKVTIALNKQEVGLTVDDPKTGKGPQTATYPNAPAVQANMILDAKERGAAYGAAWDAAAAATEAAKAASAASSAEAAKKSVLKP